MVQRLTCNAILTNRLNNGAGYQASNGYVRIAYEAVPGVTEAEQHVRVAYLFRDWLAIWCPFGDKNVWTGELVSGRLYNRKFVHVLLPPKPKPGRPKKPKVWKKKRKYVRKAKPDEVKPKSGKLPNL